MNTNAESQADGPPTRVGTPEHTGEDAASLPAYEPDRFDREFTRDRWWRAFVAAGVGLGVFVFAGWMPGRAGVTPAWGLFVAGLLVLGVWVAFAVTNARAAGTARGLISLIEQDPAGVETNLASLLRRRGLVGWVRAMVYQTWAALRHRQGRHAEAVALCHGVLSRDLGPGEGSRPGLLLMLVESALECGDWPAAYFGLCALHGLPLTLGQVLQRLGLQTRYEVATGADESAFARWHAKTDLAELMPGHLCGATHAMLAVAAHRQDRFGSAAWLDARARLLCGPEQLRQLRQQGLALPE